MNILIQSSFDTVINKKPEIILPQNLLYINGIINNIPLKMIIDTAATTSIIFKDTINKLNLHYLIDREEQICLNGIGSELSIGRLWYVEIELNKYIYPISLIASNSKILDYDMIIGINFLKTYQSIIDFKQNCLILDQNHIMLLDN